MTERYWLKASIIPGAEWVEVTKEKWIEAERSAGFRLKFSDPDYMTRPATGGWGNAGGVSGAVTFDGSSPKH